MTGLILFDIWFYGAIPFVIWSLIEERPFKRVAAWAIFWPFLLVVFAAKGAWEIVDG